MPGTPGGECRARAGVGGGVRLHASGLPDLCAFSATPEALSGRTCYQNTRYQTSSWLGGGGSERHSEARSPSGRPEPSCPPTYLPALLHLACPPPPGLIAPCLRWSCLVCVHPPYLPPPTPAPRQPPNQQQRPHRLSIAVPSAWMTWRSGSSATRVATPPALSASLSGFIIAAVLVHMVRGTALFAVLLSTSSE